MRLKHDTSLAFFCLDNKDNLIQSLEHFEKYLNFNLIKLNIETD